jgi:transcriptional regulator with XRE-family HTH domain
MAGKKQSSHPRGFGTYLIPLREGHGIKTQKELAAEIDIGRTTIGNVEAGLRPPSKEFLKALERRFPQQAKRIEAEAERHRLPRLSPEDMAWQVTQATITSQIASGDLDAAQTAISDFRSKRISKNEYYWLDLHEAEIVRLQNDSIRYLVTLLRASTLAKELGLPPAQLSSVYDKSICAALWHGGPGLAESIIEELLRMSPNLAVLWYRKAALQWGQGRFTDAYSAITSTSKAPSRDVIGTDIDCLRGLVLAELEHYGDALDAIDQALSNPRKLPAEYLCAESTRLYLALETGAIPGEKVLSAFARLEQATPENGWIFLYRSLCKLKMGDADSAFVDMDSAAMHTKPAVCSWALCKLDRVRARYNLAAVLGATGRTAQNED